MIKKKNLHRKKESTEGLDLLRHDAPDKFLGLNTVEHLQNHYRPYLKEYGAREDLITQWDLSEYDEKLYISIGALCSRTGEKLRNIIPSSRNMRTREQVIEDKKGFRVEIRGTLIDFSKDSPSNEEIDRMINILISFKRS